MRFNKRYSILSCILFTFLLLPKVVISNHDSIKDSQGILVGEICLILFLLYSLIFDASRLIQGKWVNKYMLVLYAFITYYVLASSFISSLMHAIFPIKSSIYYVRILVYFFLPFLFWKKFDKNRGGTFYDFFKVVYYIHAILAFLVYAYYSFKYTPAINDRLWNDLPGYRLMPLYGLGLNINGPDLFITVGGGSGNLLGSMSLAFLVLVDLFEKSNRVKIFSFILVLFITIFSLSRGSFLTITIFTLYTQFLRGGSVITKMVFIIFICFLTYFILSKIDDVSDYPALAQRLLTTFKDGEIDGSSSDRLINYNKVLKLLFSNPFYILFGIGFDESIVEFLTGWNLVESFLLSIFVHAGIVGIIMFINFVKKVYYRAKIEIHSKALIRFIGYSSLINWSITGSDFLTAPTLFFMLGLLYFTSIK